MLQLWTWNKWKRLRVLPVQQLPGRNLPALLWVSCLELPLVSIRHCVGRSLVVLHAGVLQRRPVLVGLELRDVLSGLLLERRHSHVVLVVPGKHVLREWRHLVRKLSVGLHGAVRVIFLHSAFA